MKENSIVWKIVYTKIKYKKKIKRKKEPKINNNLTIWKLERKNEYLTNYYGKISQFETAGRRHFSSLI